MTDETLDGVFINPGFFGMCNKCFTAVMRVMRRDTEGLNSLIKVASINYYISPKLLYEQTGYAWEGKK